ncbi:MAG: Vps62-related protein [Flavobacteriales bacterium]|jgi:hypothetical protein
MKTQKFGSLIMTFTCKFKLVWNDKEVKAKKHVAFWQPIPPKGFFPLGTVAVDHYNDINGKAVAMCVKAADDDPKAISKPMQYERIWYMGKYKRGACYRPIPKPGYVALGDVFSYNDGGEIVRQNTFASANFDNVRCVKLEYTQPGVIGDDIWLDNKSGAKKDFGAWEINTPNTYQDPKKGLFAPNTFLGVEGHKKPSSSLVNHCLNLPFPVTEGEEAPVPRLESYQEPPNPPLPPELMRSVLLPLTAVEDNGMSVEQKVELSPFYMLERSNFYNRVFFNNNKDGESEQSFTIEVTTGVETKQSSTFFKTTGISVNSEAGITIGKKDILSFGLKASGTISKEMGFSTTTDVTDFKTVTKTYKQTIPAGRSSIVWVKETSFRIKRLNGSYVSAALNFNLPSIVVGQFPHKQGESLTENHSENFKT